MMFRKTLVAVQKKQTQSGYLAAAGKTGSEEKWAHATMEYIYEKVHVNDPKKRRRDVDAEMQTSFAYDRFNDVAMTHFEARMERLIQRMNEALEAIPSESLREEALMLNSQQPPLNYRRASLTPPIFGYEPGFGFDVPQLRTQVMEYPLVVRPTDKLEFGGNQQVFPFVEAHDVAELTQQSIASLSAQHGEIREAAPVTGVEGEAWEAYTALNFKALARQQLILDLASDAELKEKYDADDSFHLDELKRRGIVDLAYEEVDPQRLEAERHYAQEPHYHPIRQF